MTNEATFEDRDELYDLAVEYARAADRRDYEAFTRITTSDAIIAVHHGDPSQVAATHSMRGHEEIVKGMAGLERYSQTMHVVTNQRVEVRGDAGHGEIYAVAHHLYKRDGGVRDRTMYIRYQDRFAREGGRWRFRERRLWVTYTTDRRLESASGG